jgi:hypothetical protein
MEQENTSPTDISRHPINEFIHEGALSVSSYRSEVRNDTKDNNSLVPPLMNLLKGWHNREKGGIVPVHNVFRIDCKLN